MQRTSKFSQQKVLQFMVIPGIVWMIIFNYIPMYGITIAFKDYKITSSMFNAPWAGLKYFKQFFKHQQFWMIMRNTLGINGLKLLIGFPLPIIFAIQLSELRNMKFKKAAQTISYLPYFISWVVLGGILITWLSESGFFNEMLIKMGIIEEGIPFLAKEETKYFWTISIVSDIWKNLGWNSIIFLAAISGINQELYEAATIDGAGRWGKIRHVTLPGIQGTVAIMFILAVGGLMRANFDQIMILRNPLNRPASEVIDIFVYRMGIETGRYSFAAAAGLFNSVFSFALLLIANNVVKKLSGSSFM